MARKIIQITSVTLPGFLGIDPRLIMFALCDDGTVWAKQPWLKGDTWDKSDWFSDFPTQED